MYILTVALSELSTGQIRVVHGSDGPAGRVGSGRVGSRFFRILAGRVGSGQHFGFFSFFTDYFLVPKSMWIFEYYIRMDWFSTIFDIIINKLINIIIQLKTVHIG